MKLQKIKIWSEETFKEKKDELGGGARMEERQRTNHPSSNHQTAYLVFFSFCAPSSVSICHFYSLSCVVLNQRAENCFTLCNMGWELSRKQWGNGKELGSEKPFHSLCLYLLHILSNLLLFNVKFKLCCLLLYHLYNCVLFSNNDDPFCKCSGI